jgi:predicted choloylglycine hydrolase
MWSIFFFLLAGIYTMMGCSSPCLKTSPLTTNDKPQVAKEKECSMEYHGSKRYCSEGVTVVILRGSPYELGYARGVLLREEIQAWARESLSEIEQQLIARNFDQDSIKENVAMLEATIPVDFKRELEGLAASSGVDYLTLLKLNVWSNVNAGCVSVAVIDVDGRLLRSRNYDWAPIRLLLPPILSIYQPDNGYGFTSIHAPGIIGVATGMNEKGITFGSHSLPGSRHSGKGMASAMLNRLVIQYATRLDEVEKMLKETPRGMPRLWLVTSWDVARAFEFDGTDIHRVEMRDGSLVLTNHGSSLNLREPSQSSLERFDAASKFLMNHSG